MLSASHLPPKQVCHHFGAQRAPNQVRSRCNSAAAAPAPTLLSATQHLPASKHDAAVQSCCRASPMLRTPQLPPKQIRHHFWALRVSIKRRSSGNSAAAAPAFTQPLRHSNGPHPSMMPQRKAAAYCLRCFMHPICPRNRCATIFAPPAHRYSIAQAATLRPQHQHPRCSLRRSICQHRA